MSVLVVAIEIEAWLFLAAVMAILLFRFVRAEMNIRTAQLNRMQFLAASVGFAAYYLSLVMSNLNEATLPAPGPAAEVMFGSSSLVYLLNKLVRMWPAITNAGRNEQGAP